MIALERAIALVDELEQLEQLHRRDVVPSETRRRAEAEAAHAARMVPLYVGLALVEELGELHETITRFVDDIAGIRDTIAELRGI